MPYEIIIITDESKPYWEDEGAIHFADIDPKQWESLFFNDMNIETYLAYTAKGDNPQSYEDYYSNQISLLEEKLPMIARFRDYYEDALISKDEIDGLMNEILTLKSIVKYEKSAKLLDQLLAASELAKKNNAGIRTAAD